MMKIKVIYNSKTGNTKKVAEAIAGAVGTSAEPISPSIRFHSLDILFIGSGVYWGNLNGKTKEFIETLNSKQIKNVAIFGTFGHSQNAIKSMKNLLKKQGINVVDKSFGCQGGFFILNSKRPDEQDLAGAKEFACEVVKEIKVKK